MPQKPPQIPLSTYYPELEGWEPVLAKEPVRELTPAIPDPNTNPNPFLRTTMPLPLQYQQDTMKQYNRPGVSSYRVSPLSPTAQAAAVSAIQSTAKIVATQVAAGSTSGLQSVALTAPQEFTVTGSPVTPPSGTLALAWATENPLTVLQVPPPGLAALQGLSVQSGNASPVSISTGVKTTPATAFLFDNSGGTQTGTPTGWTAIPSGLGWSQQISSGNSVSANVASSQDWAAQMFVLGGTPAIVQAKNTSGASGTISFTSNNTSGNMLIVYMTNFNFASQASMSPTMSDSLGNIYTTIVSQVVVVGTAHPPNDRYYSWIFVAPNCLAGANTVTFNFNDPLGHSGNISIMEIGPPTGSNFIPLFAPLFGSELPPVSLITNGPGGVTGVLPVASGGTGTSNAATGTAGGVVLSNSPTITTPTISGNETLNGKITTYNAISTVDNGVPSELAHSDLTAQSAAIGATTLYTTTAAGMFRVSYVAKVTTAATTSSTLGGAAGFQVIYTDKDDSVVVTTPTWWGGGNNGAAPTSASVNTTQAYTGGDFIVNAKAGTTIQYSFGYTSSGATAMQFNLHIKVEAM